MLDVLVIGKGLFGAAAARVLSSSGLSVAILGPDEPADPAVHDGPFASHYDQGRITRRLAHDPIWSHLARSSMAQYRALEAKSGLQFYKPSGVWSVAPANGHNAKLAEVGAELGVPFERLTAPALSQRATMFSFPEAHEAILEPSPAGYINPRDLIRAQLQIAAAQGTTIRRETAAGVRRMGSTMVVLTTAGEEIRAGRVLVATGAFTNAYDLLPAPLALRAKTEIILLARLSPAEAGRLSEMPALLYEIDSPTLEEIYLLPPIRYPDGHIYLKMGCNTAVDQWPESLAAMRAWFIGGDSDVMLPDMRAALLAFMPGLVVEAFATRRCIVCYTQHGRPYLDQVADGLYVAVGGNGKGAKSSVAVGQLAAARMGVGDWPARLNLTDFAVV